MVSQGPKASVTVLKCPFHPPLFYGHNASDAQDTLLLGARPIMCKKSPCVRLAPVRSTADKE